MRCGRRNGCWRGRKPHDYINLVFPRSSGIGQLQNDVCKTLWKLLARCGKQMIASETKQRLRSPQVDVVTVVDFRSSHTSRYEALVLLFMASWIQNAGLCRANPLHIAYLGEAPDSVIRMAQHVHAQLHCVAPMHWRTDHFVGNKLRGLEVPTETDHILLLDTDLLFLSDFSEILNYRGSLAAGLDDHPKVSVDAWRQIYAGLNEPLPAARGSCMLAESRLPLTPRAWARYQVPKQELRATLPRSVSLRLQSSSTARDILMMPGLLEKLRLQWTYLRCLGRIPNLKNPQRFTEKLQVAKLRWRDPLMRIMADKIAAKEYVASKLGQEWVTPNLYTRETGYHPYPQRIWQPPYVIKASHRSNANIFVLPAGGNDNRVICTDRNQSTTGSADLRRLPPTGSRLTLCSTSGSAGHLESAGRSGRIETSRRGC